MKTVLMALLIGHVAIVITMLVFTCIRKDIYDKLNAIFAMNTNIVLLIMFVGFIDGRYDMYIDIALSYAILGFVTTVILAKYIGGHRR
ncbi:MAG: pH regulation protein F [Clostridiales bacterium]|nr:pH regulation protein F [Candidatus Crickella caballi]